MRGLYSNIIASSYQQSVAPVIPVNITGLQLYLDANMTASYSGTGTIWNDLSSNGFVINLNGPTFVNSGGIKYLDFDGTNDFGECTTQTSALNMSATGLSIGFWGRYTTTPAALDTIITNHYGDAINHITFGLDNRNASSGNGNGFGTGVFSSGDNNAFKGVSRTIALNNWKYWMMTTQVTSSSGATIRLYENGVLVGSGSISTNKGWNYYSTIQSGFIVGAFESATSTGRYLDAGVGAVHLYNRQLNATEILDNFNATKSNYGL